MTQYNRPNLALAGLLVNVSFSRMPACSAYGCTQRERQDGVTFYRYVLNLVAVLREKHLVLERLP